MEGLGHREEELGRILPRAIYLQELLETAGFLGFLYILWIQEWRLGWRCPPGGRSSRYISAVFLKLEVLNIRSIVFVERDKYL